MTAKLKFKAWRYSSDQSNWKGPQSLELRDVEIDPPGKGEVLELIVGRNQHPGGTLTQGSDGGGLIPCSDGAGQIVAVGEEANSWKIGDRVHSLLYEGWPSGPVRPANFEGMVGSHVQGCLTQYRNFPAEFILPIPSHLSYEEAALLPCVGATLSACTHFPLPSNSTVLVQGSGGVSILVAILSKTSGARVIATSSSHDKAEKYRRIGVADVVNYREDSKWGNKVKEIAGGEGVDLVFDMGGKIFLVGLLASNEADTSLTEVMAQILFKQITVVGIFGGSQEATRNLDAFIEVQKIDVKSAIDERIFEWPDVIQAHEYLGSGKHFGKVVFRVE